MTGKELTYHNIVQNQLATLYDHMTNNLLDWLPGDDYIDEDNITVEQLNSVAAVQAIEAEWMLDPEVRATMTLISWHEDDEEG